MASFHGKSETKSLGKFTLDAFPRTPLTSIPVANQGHGDLRNGPRTSILGHPEGEHRAPRGRAYAVSRAMHYAPSDTHPRGDKVNTLGGCGDYAY